MTAQAGLRRPETVPAAERSLDQLVSAARGAQQELDVLLRVLDEGSTAQTPTLGALGALVHTWRVQATLPATQELARLSPRTRVVVVTTFENDQLVRGALRAAGYVLKRSPAADLVTAMLDVLDKLGARDRTQAVVRAYGLGMVLAGD
ncbi:hypothetical protein [Nonomuraea sp. B19D2]|uniref:hypothetical protein n=1 Tax=Nonomuraea sp. B19D2 TaxID=3159561 RepID=UPI0032D9B285